MEFIYLERSLGLPSESEIETSFDIHAVIGILDLSLGKYLLVATDRILAGTIQAHKIWRITHGLAIPIGNTLDPHFIPSTDGFSDEIMSKVIFNNKNLCMEFGSYLLLHSILYSFLLIANYWTV